MNILLFLFYTDIFRFIRFSVSFLVFINIYGVGVSFLVFINIDGAD